MGKTVKPKGRIEALRKSLLDGIRKKRTEEAESQVARSEKDTDERK